jgi:hypothetical protein
MDETHRLLRSRLALCYSVHAAGAACRRVRHSRVRPCAGTLLQHTPLLLYKCLPLKQRRFDIDAMLEDPEAVRDGLQMANKAQQHDKHLYTLLAQCHWFIFLFDFQCRKHCRLHCRDSRSGRNGTAQWCLRKRWTDACMTGLAAPSPLQRVTTEAREPTLNQGTGWARDQRQALQARPDETRPVAT